MGQRPRRLQNITSTLFDLQLTLKIPKNTYLSQKAYLVIGIVILLITIGALFSLSYSITKNSQQNYAYVTKKNFTNKLKSLETEFKKIDNYLSSLDTISYYAHRKDLSKNFEIINQVYTPGDYISLNWYIIVDKNNHPVQWYTATDQGYIPSMYLDLIKNESTNNSSALVQQDSKTHWLIYRQVELPDELRIFYGITVDLNNLHTYLADVDATNANYAFIFTKDGLCIYHPETNLLGVNLFEQGIINEKDTINSHQTNELGVRESEYLKLDIIRFLAPFKSDNLSGYIMVNFPKFNADDNLQPIKQSTTLIFITAVGIIVILFFLFFRANKRAQTQKELLAVAYEKVDKEKALAELQQLKNQINPHFLFNSLNSLYMLINIDANTATQFTLNLSKIYRYLIHPPSTNIVSVEQELNFIKQYIDLQKIRFNQELKINIIEESTYQPTDKIPFLALQITIENALKHNIATLDNPLVIQIILQKGQLLVTNNYQPLNNTEHSENFGLNYLKTIYDYYNVPNFAAQIKRDDFVCVLPFIQQ